MTDILKVLEATNNSLRPFRALEAQLAPFSEIQKQLAPILDLQKAFGPTLAIREQLRSFGELGVQWKGLNIQTPAWASTFRNVTLEITQALEPALSLYKNVFEPFAPIFQAIARTSAECRAIENAGWLPHYTTPFEALAETEDEDFDAVIEAHYRERWPDVKADFVAHIDASPLDSEAKAAFLDALNAHEAGMYRATSRILFPEIERVARKEFHGHNKGQTSQRALRAAAEHLGLSDVEPGGMYAFRLFEKLFDHLYAKTETPDELADVALDPVPNRHAALHGFLPYDSAKNSINMLVMADFLFQVICALKAQRDAEGDVQIPREDAPLTDAC